MEQGELGEGRDEKDLLFLSGFFHIFGRFLYPLEKKNTYIESRAGGGWGTGWGQGQHLGLEYLAGSLEGHCGPPRLY